MTDKATIERIKEIALQASPEEACGILRAGEVIQLPNQAIDRTRAFRIAPTFEGVPEAIWHTHPATNAKPSQADLAGCRATQIPYLIVAATGAWTLTRPEQVDKIPLLGREFSHGTLDCYTLVRDWYREERGIALPDFAREDDWWLKPGRSLYRDENLRLAGFKPMPADTKPRKGDVMIMRIGRALERNHAGVWLTGGLLLHHLPHRLSTREPHTVAWQRRTETIARYGVEKGH